MNLDKPIRKYIDEQMDFYYRQYKNSLLNRRRKEANDFKSRIESIEKLFFEDRVILLESEQSKYLKLKNEIEDKKLDLKLHQNSLKLKRESTKVYDKEYDRYLNIIIEGNIDIFKNKIYRIIKRAIFHTVMQENSELKSNRSFEFDLSENAFDLNYYIKHEGFKNIMTEGALNHLWGFSPWRFKLYEKDHVELVNIIRSYNDKMVIHYPVLTKEKELKELKERIQYKLNKIINSEVVF